MNIYSLILFGIFFTIIMLMRPKKAKNAKIARNESDYLRKAKYRQWINTHRQKSELIQG